MEGASGSGQDNSVRFELHGDPETSSITHLIAGVPVSDLTLIVAGLDELLERLAARHIEHEPIETYSNGVRHVNIPDPDRRGFV